MPLRRPAILLRCATVGLAFLVGAAGAAATPNPIQLENARPGSPGWDLPGGTATHIPTPSRSIEGYASEISLAPGDVLHLHVSTIPAAAYRVEIYRLGWYQGTGGRRIDCLPSCSGSEAGRAQPVPAPDATTGILDAGWPITDTVVVDASWTSGYFVAKLVLTSGPAAGQASWVPFIVRAAPGARSAVLVQASVNTWEAYNNWGGKSLYTFNSTGAVVPASGTVAAAMVSFDRPFANATDVFQYEYDRVRWLERSGYDVSYQTDVDTDANPASLLGHRLDVVSGHDEYWSPAMRNAWEAARAAGVNLAFLGGNIGYWQARYAAGGRTLVEYRSARLDPDPVPSQKTVPFSAAPLNRPECQLLGVGYPGGLANLQHDPPRSYTVTSALTASPWSRGTGLHAGAAIFDSVGYEWDNVQPGCAVPPVTVLLHFAGLKGVLGSPASADAVTYTAPSGAQVVSDGSLQMAWTLDDFGHAPHANPGMQALFSNIFDSLGSAPGPAPPGALSLLSPIAGTITHDPVRLRWSAGGFATYIVSVDGRIVGTLPASACSPSRCSMSYAPGPGRHTWSVQGVDAMGNRSLAGPLAFRVDDTPPSPFGLRFPRRASVLWNPAPRVCWTASHDAGAGLADYEVVVDGRVRGETTKRCLALSKALSEGRHRLSVLAVDRAGNQRAAPLRRFVVRSVRLEARTPTSAVLRVFCPRRCTISVRARRRPLTARPGHAGINTITVRVSPGPQTLVVRVRTRRAVRTVGLSVPG